MSKKGHSISTIVITIFAVLIILALSIAFFYFAVKSESFSQSENTSFSGISNAVKESASWRTNIIAFSIPEVLPQQKKQGECLSYSIADPFRPDAFRCQVKNEIFDPCFETQDPAFVFCQPNPLTPESFLIELEKPLPQPSLLDFTQDNWAWFLKLEDGSYCRPFTGIRPVIQGKLAYYACASVDNPLDDKEEHVILFGDLEKSRIWTADKAVITQDKDKWIIKSEEKAKIDTVWQ